MKVIDIEEFSAEAVEPMKAIIEALSASDETVVLKANGETICTVPQGAIKKDNTEGDFPRDVKQDKSKRVPGTAKGQVWISPDFDELPEDLAQSFGVIDR